MPVHECYKQFPSYINSSEGTAMWLEQDPGLEDLKYIVTEKYRGAAVQFIFLPDGTYYIASKRAMQGWGFRKLHMVYDTHFKIPEVIFAHLAYHNQRIVNVFGTVYGDSLKKFHGSGINYNEDVDLKFHSLAVSDKGAEGPGELFTPAKFYQFMAVTKLNDLTPPILGKYDSLTDAMQHPFSGEAALIVQPYNQNFEYPEANRMFWIKRDNPDVPLFYEKKTPRVYSDRVRYFAVKFEQFLNNAFKDTLNCLGEIESKEEIGRYIKFALALASDWFFDTVDDSDTLTNEEEAIVCNQGNKLSKIILKHMGE